MNSCTIQPCEEIGKFILVITVSGNNWQNEIQYQYHIFFCAVFYMKAVNPVLRLQKNLTNEFSVKSNNIFFFIIALLIRVIYFELVGSEIFRLCNQLHRFLKTKVSHKNFL